MTPAIIPPGISCACERNDWQRLPGDGGTIIACRECGQCHTPGCAFWIKAAPDIPLSLEPWLGDDQ